MREKLRAQTVSQLQAASQNIAARLSEIEIEKDDVALFLAQAREPNLDEFACALIKNGKRVFAPRSHKDEFFFSEIAPDWSNIFCNARGWREAGEYSRPGAACNQENIGAIFLPGLAFDVCGNRLGQGGGWYDRALENFAPGVLRIGVCFDFQVVENIPVQAHDRRVDIVVTEQRTIRI